MRLNSTLLTVLTALSAWSPLQAFACDATSLEGIWTRSLPEANSPGTGTTITFTIRDGALVSKTEFTDSLTSAGYGPYYEGETRYKTTLDSESCTLFGTSVSSTQRSLRRYDEPTPSVSETTTTQTRLFQYRVTVSSDGKTATFDNGENPVFTMDRS